MKSSTMLWLAVLITFMMIGEYQLWIHRDIWRTSTDASLFILINILIWVIWEMICGISRSPDEAFSDSDYSYKNEGFKWVAFTPLFLIYILIRYYVNPFLDKTLK